LRIKTLRPKISQQCKGTNYCGCKKFSQILSVLTTDYTDVTEKTRNYNSSTVLIRVTPCPPWLIWFSLSPFNLLDLISVNNCYNFCRLTFLTTDYSEVTEKSRKEIQATPYFFNRTIIRSGLSVSFSLFTSFSSSFSFQVILSLWLFISCFGNIFRQII
jgi:hypothetical protein